EFRRASGGRRPHALGESGHGCCRSGDRPPYRRPQTGIGRSAMEKFTLLTAVAAPLPMINVDTDIIIPARFLKTIKRTGLGKSAFYALRYDENGAERPDFVLNQDRYRGAKI